MRLHPLMIINRVFSLASIVWGCFIEPTDTMQQFTVSNSPELTPLCVTDLKPATLKATTSFGSS